MTGNADAHAKNLSFVRRGDRGDGYGLAPFYDLVCTRMYDRIDRYLAMSVGGEFDPDRVRAPQLVACATAADVKTRWLFDTASTMAEAVANEIDGAVASSGVVRSPAAPRIVSLVRKQAKRLLRELRR